MSRWFYLYSLYWRSSLHCMYEVCVLVGSSYFPSWQTMFCNLNNNCYSLIWIQTSYQYFKVSGTLPINWLVTNIMFPPVALLANTRLFHLKCYSQILKGVQIFRFLVILFWLAGKVIKKKKSWSRVARTCLFWHNYQLYE